MQSELINPFVLAGHSVLEMVLGAPPERGELKLEKASFTNGQVNIVCGVTGQVVGQVMYGMSLHTADKIASIMIGQKVTTFDQLAASAIAELANMISGNGLLKLAEGGFVADLAPPTIVKGSNVQISTLSIPAIAVPFKLVEGEFVITLALHQAK
jgi:chemotaxis protein CheX